MILITGGTGNSGSEIVSQLAATGTRFRAMARDPRKAQTKVGSASRTIEFVQGDLEDPASLDRALAGIDTLLMLSSPGPNQVEQESNLLNSAKRAKVRHIVKFSAMTADPKSPARFPRSHGAIERQIQSSGIAWTFLRPTFFMQNLLMLAGMVKQGTIYQPTGDSKAGFVDTRDIAAVAVKALTESGHEGKAYEITGPELLSYHDIARTLSQITGRAIKYQDIPPAAARQAMLGMGMPEWNVDGINELMDQMRAGQYAKLSTAVRDVGRKTPISFAQFARENAATWNA